jgi:tetratricopeptide (TPR) repeat protein
LNVTATLLENPTSRSSSRWAVGLIALAALAMGLPTTRGGFVGGDDHRLALNHVFVNHPSWEHAVKLFTVQHRDLYQPLPLLTFQAEFLVAQTFDLFRDGPDAGGWFFHLNNVFLHTINAILVFFVVRMLQTCQVRGGAVASLAGSERRRTTCEHTVDGAWPVATAAVAGLLFAVHPLQMETIAWLNGRMMLLSTLFLLLALLVFSSWLDRPRPATAVLTLLLVVLCAISKVRIGLPVLLLIVAYLRAGGFRTRFWSLWIPVTLVTAIFAYVNVEATSDVELFEQGAAYLRGPRLARVLMALAFYFEHIVWPTGLSSYYPTPPLVAWSDPAAKRALIVVGIAFALLAWAAWRSRVFRSGILWFAATVFATLPIFPARNILAADRYMYVPLIGVGWIVGAFATAFFARTVVHRARSVRFGVPAAVGGLLVPLFIGIGWYTAHFYETPLLKTQRVADLFPDTPRVWEPYGWTLHSLGRYDEAEYAARMELRHDAPKVRGGAYLLLGVCALDRGDVREAVRLMEQSIQEDPESARTMFRLGGVYELSGDPAKAAEYYEKSVALTPMHNPSLNRLASCYRLLGRPDDARDVYQRALDFSHGYDVHSVMGLVELDLDDGSRERLVAARDRLEELLSWMPENLDARTNLGVVLTRLGSLQEAAKVYGDVLSSDPQHVTANLNLAQLLVQAGAADRAARHFQIAADVGPGTLEQAIAVHDYLVDGRQTLRLPSLWERYLVKAGESTEALAYTAWAHALVGNVSRAREILASLADADSPTARAATLYADLAAGSFDDAWSHASHPRLAAADAARTRRQLLAALQYFDSRNPNLAWTFCLAGRILLAGNNSDAAKISAELCENHCRDEVCRRAVAELRSGITHAASP